MKGQGGSLFADLIFIGMALLAAAGLIWWIMPADWEAGAAEIMQAALPLGDATVIEHEHAVMQHSAEAIAVRECINNGGMFAIYQKPDGRFVRLCNLPDGKFGMQICADSGDCFHEITAFIKNKFTRLEQLLQHLKNMGAAQVWP